jgi:hypothetical protein
MKYWAFLTTAEACQRHLRQLDGPSRNKPARIAAGPHTYGLAVCSVVLLPLRSLFLSSLCQSNIQVVRIFIESFPSRFTRRFSLTYGWSREHASSTTSSSTTEWALVERNWINIQIFCDEALETDGVPTLLDAVAVPNSCRQARRPFISGGSCVVAMRIVPLAGLFLGAGHITHADMNARRRPEH